MKHFNKVFDIFLYEGIFIFLFSWLLFILNDRYTEIVSQIGIVSLIIAAVLGAVGRFFNLFTAEDTFEEQ